MEWGDGMNLNNLMMLGTNPSPQGTPSAYQPSGSMYTGLGQSSMLPMPYQPRDINVAAAQSQRAPGFNRQLNSMPLNVGVARNSPARAYLAAMAAGKVAGSNAASRASIPLQYVGANANAALSSQISQSQYNQQNGLRGAGYMMQLLSPFLNQLLDEG